MNKKLSLIRPGVAIGNRFKAQIIERRANNEHRGQVIYESPEAPNLILENGMNGIATKLICNLFKYCAIGSGTTPTQDSSGAITATCSGTAVTAGTSIFTSGDVGKLLRFATGEKAVIASYTDGTHVTLASSLTVSSSTLFTMYRIAQTGLDTEVKRTDNYLTGTGNCGTTLSSGVFTHTRTFDFPIETSDQTYNEVGFSDASGAGANLNMRGIFAGAPITVLTGQQLRVIYDVQVTVSPISPRSRSVTISGWPSLQHSVTADHTTELITLVAHGFAANTQVQLIGTTPPTGLSFSTVYYVVPSTADTFGLSATSGGAAINFTTDGSGLILLTNTNGVEQVISSSYSSVDTSGNTQNNNGSVCEPSGASGSSKYSVISVDSASLPAFPSGSVALSTPTGGDQVLSQDSYTSGSYFSTWRTTYAVGNGNSSAIRKLTLSYNPAYMDGAAYLFDQKQEKTSLYTLTVVWAFAWDRDFV